MTRCTRCGGTCVDWDDEGLQCLLCARPYVASAKPGLRLVREDADDVTSVIERERRTIDRALAAGKRAWS